MAAVVGFLFVSDNTGRAQATPVTYDATQDFSTASNPNGVWTYGYEATGGAAFVPYTATISTNWVGNIGGDGTPVLGVNSSGTWNYGVAPGQLALHPGPSGQPSVLRWTAPAGINPLVSVLGQFFAGDSGSMQVGIYLNNNWVTPLFQATDYGSFSFSQSVTVGDTIDFAVYGAYYSGSTPLDAVITAGPAAVPEIDPAGIGAVLALVTGALGLVERRRGRRADSVRGKISARGSVVAGRHSAEGDVVDATATGPAGPRHAAALAFAIGIVILAGVTAQATPIQWTTASGGNGHYYDRIEQTGLTFTAARNAAATLSYLGLPGRLVVFETAGYVSELAFVMDNVYAPGVQSDRMYWVGASSPNGFDPWTWIDGSTAPTGITSTWNIDRYEGAGSYGIGFYRPATTLWDYIQSNSSNAAFGYVVEYQPSAVPEIDPAGIGAVLALVTGALGLVERRRLRAFA